MAYIGVLTKKNACAICKDPLAVGERVYFNPQKKQGSHLAHEKCWDDLRASREPKIGPPGIKLSHEELDPPF